MSRNYLVQEIQAPSHFRADRVTAQVLEIVVFQIRELCFAHLSCVMKSGEFVLKWLLISSNACFQR